MSKNCYIKYVVGFVKLARIKNYSFFFFQGKMSQVEADVGTEQIPEAAESLFTTLDFVILIALIGLGTWWLLRNRKKEESNVGRSYSIQ